MSSQDYIVTEKVLTDGEIPVTIYTNKITGLRVVIAYVECPIVKGDIAFATEAFDDDGLPHTLEHLVFLGSEDYPYKGVLDLLANRSLASGTNALTDTDYTNYQLVTAGTEGFLNLLPIYLDHLLFPTLSESAYITEVHHINERGEDSGVVYCEMQARENTGDERCFLEMNRSAYPGVCGYSSQTGGILHNLRTSTNNKKCTDFHKKFYCAKNCCVIVTGPVKPDNVFRAIKPIDDKIVAKGLHKIEFERPWMNPVEPLKTSVSRKIQYPCDTEDDGLVYIGFRGPSVVTNFKELITISTLLDYLDSTAISPLQRDFVECDEPYCSSVSHSIIENSVSLFYLTFESVGSCFLDKVEDKLYSILKGIVNGKENLDMDRMRTIISRKIVKILSAAECSPHSMVLGPVIGHFLYGTSQLVERAQEIPILKALESKDDKFWRDMIDCYMTGENARHVCIVGEPSKDLMTSMKEAEEKRLATQKEEMKDQLDNIAEKVKKAVENNERPPPSDMLTSISIPSTDSIKLHPIERVVLTELPFRFQYDSIKTNFVSIHAFMDTSSLPREDRLYLPLLSEILLETPIERNGALIPYEQIVAELYSDTISYASSIGLGSSSAYYTCAFSMLFSVAMQVTIEKYEKAVQWFNEILYRTVLTPERLKNITTRMVSEISQLKRSGGKVSGSIQNGLLFQSNCNQWATNFMRQHKFLKKLLLRLKDEPEAVQKDITRIRDAINRPENMFVHVTLNKEKVNTDRLHEPWMKLDRKPTAGPLALDKIVKCHESVEFAKNHKALIVGVGSVESNYMLQSVKTPINHVMHPDLPAVQVLINYLIQLEGPMWRQIRGLGLSYSYSISLAASEGLMQFRLYKATQLVEAYNKSVEIVNKHLSGDEPFEDALFDSAKSSLIFEYINREKSAADKSFLSLIAYLRNLDIDFNKEIIKKIFEVTKDDLRRVGPIYLRPLFEDVERRAAICCHPSKIDGITAGLDMPFEKVVLEEEPLINSIDGDQ